ncbi:HvfC/BufC N-terminal domain-containing protein [Polaromonas sp. P5_D5]
MSTPLPLGQFQQAFAQALFAHPAAVGPEMQLLATQPAFAVYRNTVMKACIDALEANFPAVARLVGDEWFRAAAALYVETEAPKDARLLYYGNGFSDFLRGFEPAAELVYLPGVAQLDIFWREAHVASDAPAVDAAWVAAHTPEQMATLVLSPHPAARWAWFDEQPVYSIWERNRRSNEINKDLTWRGEGALLTRPRDAVVWSEITKAGCVFLDACAGGRTLAHATASALAVDPKADLATTFACLLRSGAFAGNSI